MATASEILGRIGDSMHAGRSYGPPIEHDGCLVIPVAYVFGGGGGGGAADIADRAELAGGGSGGGFGYVSWPVGVYVIRNGDVSWRPVIDIGGLALVGGRVLRTMASLRRHRRAARRP